MWSAPVSDQKRWPTFYALTLWGPLVLGGTYVLAWSVWSDDPAPYRPILGVAGAMMLVAAVTNILIALIRRGRARPGSPTAATGSAVLISAAKTRREPLKVVGQVVMVAGGLALPASFHALVDDYRMLAAALLIAAVAGLAIGGFLYWLNYRRSLGSDAGQADPGTRGAS